MMTKPASVFNSMGVSTNGLKTDAGFVILIDQHSICGFSRDLIFCSQPIDMNQQSIKNVKSPVNKFDAVNKAYTDRIKYK